MAIVKCSNSHYYDNGKFKECPHCARLAAGQGAGAVPAALEAQQVGDYATAYIRRNLAAGAPGAAGTASAASAEGADADREDPCGCTAGWLVCVKGLDYGRSFPLYAGFNRIGRGAGNDVVLRDAQVSREEHCSVVYEEKKNVFYVFPKAGNLSYLEGEMVEGAQELRSGQKITLGETDLEFAAFCMGEKRWPKKKR